MTARLTAEYLTEVARHLLAEVRALTTERDDLQRRLDAAMAAMRVAASILEQAGDELEAAGVVCNKIEVARLLLSSIDATPPHDPKGDD